FSVKKLITLASIIEKETGAAGERPSISAVFQNRLKKRIRLQSDPTVIYGIKDFDGNLTKRHLQTPTPYNTYTNFGLPPGPIANPGKDSIRAALNPANEEYLYFVSMNNGAHYFSKSLREHNNAVNTYQRKRGRKGA
ncbi:MAG: endolytic transglycosylase MltG, partial [Deltaproteobacteria bacterium]|nr:endolytic transglycosylase MltG [Deltaproteobacteria bacterium]